jgi:hypothetical protein
MAGAGAAPWGTFSSIGLGGGTTLSVNLVSGNLLASTPGPVLPQINEFDLSVAPVYNDVSRGVVTDTGVGWLTGTGRDVGLDVNTAGQVTFYDATGFGWTFAEPSSCSFTSPAGIDATLSCSGSNYRLTYNGSHLQLQFNSL